MRLLRRSDIRLLATALIGGLVSCTQAGPAVSLPSETRAEICPEDALGVSRTLVLGLDSLPAHDLLSRKEVILTFDDGPHPVRTVRVLNALASECVTATFFLIGENAAKHPEMVRKITDRGHNLGGHTRTHRRMTDLPLAEAQADILAGQDKIEAAYENAEAAPPIAFFRYPFLASSPELDAFLVDNKLIRMDVTTDGSDWSDITGPEIIDNVMAGLAARDEKGVILLHDPSWVSSHIVGQLLDRLKAEGYSVVAIRSEGNETAS